MTDLPGRVAVGVADNPLCSQQIHDGSLVG